MWISPASCGSGRPGQRADTGDGARYALDALVGREVRLDREHADALDG